MIKLLLYILLSIISTFSNLSGKFVAHDDRIVDINLSHDGNFYITGGKDGKVIVWDNQTDKIIAQHYVNETQLIEKVALSFNNQLIAIGFYNGNIDLVELNGEKIQTLENNTNSDDNNIVLLKFISNQKLISCQFKDVIREWHISSSEDSMQNGEKNIASLQKQFTEPIEAIVGMKINSNNKNIIARLRSRKMARWDIGAVDFMHIAERQKISKQVINEKIIETPSKSWWKWDPHKYYDFDISPNGSNIAIATDEHSIMIWNANFNENIITINPHEYRITNIIFSEDGKYLATSSIDKTIKIWNASRGDLVKMFELNNDLANKIIFNNNKIICATIKGQIKKYNF